MTGKDSDIPKISTANTKKEILDAYNLVIKKIAEQSKATLKPEQALKAKKEKEVVEIADATQKEGVIKKLFDLKEEIGRTLSNLANKLESERDRYVRIKEAIEVKERELKEIIDIEKSAFTLAALIETQKIKKVEFEDEMEKRKKELNDKITNTRGQWDKEGHQHLQMLKEQKAEEEKLKQREKEEYEYQFQREKELKTQTLKDEIEKLEKDLQTRKDAFENEITKKEDELMQRDITITERERIVNELQKRVDSFPKELENGINKAVNEAVARHEAEANKNEQLLLKGFDGEKNVFLTRIESLEKLADTQKHQIEALSAQLENAYGKVQDIAVQAVTSQPIHSHPSPTESSSEK